MLPRHTKHTETTTSASLPRGNLEAVAVSRGSPAEHHAVPLQMLPQVTKVPLAVRHELKTQRFAASMQLQSSISQPGGRGSQAVGGNCRISKQPGSASFGQGSTGSKPG